MVGSRASLGNGLRRNARVISAVGHMKPPAFIDGARVLEWAWSRVPFGYVLDSGAPIYGLDVCRYDGETRFYRFSCNERWQTEQDDVYDSLEEAKLWLPKQYQEVFAEWHVLPNLSSDLSLE